MDMGLLTWKGALFAIPYVDLSQKNSRDMSLIVAILYGEE